ncbi:MAG: hypothetical protein IPN05_08550 [Sulfuritalea sp.]|nr:hypothetical protein [Sulfuritalea sp.]
MASKSSTALVFSKRVERCDPQGNARRCQQSPAASAETLPSVWGLVLFDHSSYAEQGTCAGIAELPFVVGGLAVCELAQLSGAMEPTTQQAVPSSKRLTRRATEGTQRDASSDHEYGTGGAISKDLPNIRKEGHQCS